MPTFLYTKFVSMQQVPVTCIVFLPYALSNDQPFSMAK